MGQEHRDLPQPAAGAVVEVEQPTEEMIELFGVAFSAAEHFAQMLAEQGECEDRTGRNEGTSYL